MRLAHHNTSPQKTVFLSASQVIEPSDSGTTWNLGAPRASAEEVALGHNAAVNTSSLPLSTANLSANSPAAQAKLQQQFSESDYLQQMAELIANCTESYTVAIYSADDASQSLRLCGVHTLSREFLREVEIPFGAGLVGWTAQNRVRISVCPFERDAKTLLYYSADQDLKSFIAVPILDSKQQLRGVIACDSKKSYAYTKVAEKILLDCAVLIAQVSHVFSHLGSSKKNFAEEERRTVLANVVAKLRSITDEEELLLAATRVPNNLVEREALVVVTTAEFSGGINKFYPTDINSRGASNGIEHRLIELVCKHKGVLAASRSVHSLPVDDVKQRSFLSIPFRVLDKEAGSLNLLSRPRAAFTSGEIAAMETVASTLGEELERIRLRQSAAAMNSAHGLLGWKGFSLQAKNLLLIARRDQLRLGVARLSLGPLYAEVEKIAGISVTGALSTRFARLVDQVVRAPAISGMLCSGDYLIIGEWSEMQLIVPRLERLLLRLNFSDVARGPEISGGSETRGTARAEVNLSSLIQRFSSCAVASYPHDGETIEELAAVCSRGGVNSLNEHWGEVVNAGIR